MYCLLLRIWGYPSTFTPVIWLQHISNWQHRFLCFRRSTEHIYIGHYLYSFHVHGTSWYLFLSKRVKVQIISLYHLIIDFTSRSSTIFYSTLIIIITRYPPLKPFNKLLLYVIIYALTQVTAFDDPFILQGTIIIFISYYMIMVFTNILNKHQNNFIHTKCVVLLRRGGIYIRRRRIWSNMFVFTVTYFTLLYTNPIHVYMLYIIRNNKEFWLIDWLIKHKPFLFRDFLSIKPLYRMYSVKLGRSWVELNKIQCNNNKLGTWVEVE